MSYGMDIQREREYGGTKVINCCEKYVLEYDIPKAFPQMSAFHKKMLKLFVKNLEIISE